MIHGLLNFINVAVLVYFLLLNMVYFLTAFLALKTLRKYRYQMQMLETQTLLELNQVPGISIIAPAYNEEATCVESIRALLNLQYSEYEILVINDGSSDHTLDVLKTAFELKPVVVVPMANIEAQAVRQVYQSPIQPNLWVIDKDNGGKADALNVGLNYCRFDLFCAIDADTLIERDALLRVVRPFLEDRHTIAAGGIIRIINDCPVTQGMVTQVKLPKNIWARIQVLEYFRAFLIARVGWDALNGLLIISGAFGLFKRSLVIEVGGYETQTVGEDMELVVRMHHYCRKNHLPYRVAFVADPVAWTECPESLAVLGRQRERWQRGLTEVMLKYKHMLFNTRFGVLGIFVFPYFLILETLGSILEFVGYLSFLISWYLGYLSLSFMLSLLILGFLLGLFLSVFSFFLEELTFHRYRNLKDFFNLLGVALFENFGYRQMSSYWRFKGTVKTLLGIKGSWGQMTRKGFEKSDAIE